MRLMLDTNRYVDFCRGVPEVVDTLRRADQIHLSFITLAELRSGFLCGSRSRHNERTLTRFLGSSRVRVLFPDDQTPHHYARLFQQLRGQGTPMPTNDLWMASLTLQHALVLISRDSHFDNLPQLARL
ncbi:MAG: type II toxin-antitoxin system VapC family toxin [Verrucomicrobiota bacterium]